MSLLEEIRKDIASKYDFYLDTMQASSPDDRYRKHDCGNASHSVCLKNWGHSCILLEIISRLYWCFFDYQPVWCNIKTRPKLKDVLYFVFSNRVDLDIKEYEYIMKQKDQLKALIPNYYGCPKSKKA